MRHSFALLFLTVVSVAASGCRSKKPEVVVAPAPLDEGAAAALRWVDAHAAPIPRDAATTSAARAPLVAFASNARVVGISELTEGVHEFPLIVQGILGALGDESGARGLAVQASMAEAMDLDHYVRSGVGVPQRLLRALGPHWETQEVLALVQWMHDRNRGRAAGEQIGFYGFELPNAARAVRVATSLPDSVAGAALNRWLNRELQCVGLGESAAWGLGSAAADSGFWNRCRVVTAAAVDSLHAVGERIRGSRAAGDVAFAEQMARLLFHHVSVGLRHLPRHETVAEHIRWLADGLGSDHALVVWGRDVEAGRLTLQGGVVQSAVALSRALGDRYRNLAFTAGGGVIRARPISPGREPGNERDLRLRMPSPGTFEDVLNRAKLDAFLLDVRPTATDTTGAWLRGPRRARLISGVYTPDVPGAFETPLDLPANFDGFLFVRVATPAVPLKR